MKGWRWGFTKFQTVLENLTAQLKITIPLFIFQNNIFLFLDKFGLYLIEEVNLFFYVMSLYYYLVYKLSQYFYSKVMRNIIYL